MICRECFRQLKFAPILQCYCYYWKCNKYPKKCETSKIHLYIFSPAQKCTNQANLKFLIIKSNVTPSLCFNFLWIQLKWKSIYCGLASAALSTTNDSTFCKMPNLQIWEMESKDWKTFIICLHYSLSYKLDRNHKKRLFRSTKFCLIVVPSTHNWSCNLSR